MRQKVAKEIHKIAGSRRDYQILKKFYKKIGPSIRKTPLWWK